MKIDYTVAFKIDGQWTQDTAFKRPLMTDAPLDETLDTGIIVDAPSELKKIPPFTLCRVTARDHNESDPTVFLYKKYYWTADRNATAETMFGGTISSINNQLFTQQIKLIELTKILERIPCDSLSFTHRLRKSRIENAKFADFSTRAWTQQNGSSEELPLGLEWFKFHEGDDSFLYFTPDDYTEFNLRFIPIYYIGESGSQIVHHIKVTSNGATIIDEDVEGESGVLNYRNDSAAFESDYGGNVYIRGSNPRQKLTLPQSAGIYEIVYSYSFLEANFGIIDGYYINISYNIELKSADIPAKPIPSISDVIERILRVGVGRPIYKTQKYSLDSRIKDIFDNTPSPEFFFTRMTMFEALLEVGRKIQAIPRLTVDENENPVIITYDLLGLDEGYTIPEDAIVIGYKPSQGIDDYCGGLDSYVENHINTVDPDAGTLTEPFDGGFKTLRCESGVKIDNPSAVFEVTKPIYRIVKVEMGFCDGEQSTVIGDITKFIYEQAEYDGLFAADTATFPNSVSHALVWKQGDRFIRGFNTMSSSLLNLIQQFNYPSIQNIVSDLQKNFGTNAYGNLGFRVTYIPMDSLRLRQYKPYETHPDDVLLYNQQSANTVEASYYGENLKGKIARMGNEIEVFTLRLKSPADLPKLGNVLLDDNDEPHGYVYKITESGRRDDIVADIYVTQDFNRLSEYFSIASNFRLFEVSERQSIDRQINVSRIIKIGFEPLTKESPVMCAQSSMRRFMGTLIAGKSGWETWVGYYLSVFKANKRANVAVCRLVADEQNEHEQIGDYCFTFPVNSTAAGNSLAFSFGFEDSFSAGHRSAPAGFLGAQWKQRKNTPYGDAYGEFFGMEFGIAKTIYRPNGLSSIEYSPTWNDQKAGFDDDLPSLKTEDFVATMRGAYISTGSILLNTTAERTSMRVVEKNSSEHISVTLQIHGRMMDKKIVVGSALWNNNLLIRDNPVEDGNGNIRTPHVYGFKTPKRMNMLRSTIDIADSNVEDIGVIQSLAVGTYGGMIESMTLSTTTDFYAWCIADSVTGDIYIGVNEAIKKNENTSPIYFNTDWEA